MILSYKDYNEFWYGYMWAIDNFKILGWDDLDYEWVDDGHMRLYRI